MTNKFWLLAVLSCSHVHSKIVRQSNSEIVRGQGFAAPPPGHQLQVQQHHVQHQQQQYPFHQQQSVKSSIRNKKPVKVISEFDKPGSFQPMKDKYSKQKFEPTTEKSFVNGPPLGDDFFERYSEMIKKRAQKKSKLSFEGLLPDDLIDRRKRKHQDPPVPAFYQIKPPVTLDFHSPPVGDFSFNPNGKWYGDKATGLLQPPNHNIKHRQVSLDFVSPSSGEFNPNNNWFGEKQTGFFTYPNHLVPKRDSVHVTVPAKEESQSKENFSPSGWHVYRNKVIETGTRSSLYKDQDEPLVITLDNVADYLKTHSVRGGNNPDVFDVNVQAVIKTKDAPNAGSQYYLKGY